MSNDSPVSGSSVDVPASDSPVGSSVDAAEQSSEDSSPLSPRQSGAHLDRLAELEEERRFLLRSLDDLEREYEVGDVDTADYDTLKDGYTVRAAAVLREIDSGRSRLAPKAPRRWGRLIGVTAGVLVLAVAIGFVLAGAFGERGSGDEITGFNPGNDARVVLASARDAQNSGDFALANALFGRVVQMERERGVDNVEAITYFGWTLALQARQESADMTTDDRLDAARLALSQAIQLDPDYADPNCFLAIVEYAFLDDATAALPYVEVCESSNPPADLAELIGSFAEEIRSAA
jgi:tetratricopeptide (TPR) repeat protein